MSTTMRLLKGVTLYYSSARARADGAGWYFVKEVLGKGGCYEYTFSDQVFRRRADALAAYLDDALTWHREGERK